MPKKYGLFISLIILTSCQASKKIENRYDTSNIDSTPADGGTYIEASIGDASYLNPLLAADSASNDINSQVYNGLIRYDKNIKFEADLAQSWEILQGGKKIIFHLRKNVTWHDGEPFTSADVLFTYQKRISTTTLTPYSSDFVIVKKAEAPDPFTFVVTYDKPFAPGLESWGMGIIPKHVYEKGDINTNPANRHPIGTGPYQFVSWDPAEKIILKANPNYYEGRPHIERFVYRIIPDLSVQFLLLRQGALSVMTPTPDQYNGYDEFFLHYNKFKYPAFRYDYIAFNLTNPLFQNKKIRQALSHAINKQDIIDGVYQGMAVSATGPFPPASWAFNSDVKDYDYDPELAKRMLAEEGWADHDNDGFLDKNGKNFSFTLITNQGNKVRESIAQIAQNSFSKIGIDMDIRILEWAVFLKKYVDAKNFDACLLGWNLSRDPDPYPMWHSSQSNPGQYNFVSYKNAEVDALLDQGRTVFDQKAREKIYKRLHAVIAEDAPYIFLVNSMSLPVVHKEIMGVELAPAGLGWNLIHWYIPKPWQNRDTFTS